MKPSWFCVVCKVDNGCTIEKWRSMVYATTATEAAKMAKADWEVRDNETVATVLSVRMISETEIFTTRAR